MAKALLAMAASFLWLAGPLAAIAETGDLIQIASATNDQSEVPDDTVRHECISFDPASVYVASDSSGYWLTAGREMIKEVNGSRAEARLAVYIIRYYGMIHYCRIESRRTALTYYLVGGRAPSGRSPSEDCIWFNQTGSRLIHEDGQWLLVDNNGTSLGLGRDEAAAEEAVNTIRRKNFSEICFVGRPNPSMVYFIR